MTTPIVSVVVLTFNSEPYIERCLRSLKLQTLQNFEVLIVDAGSKDQTSAIVARYDERFRWVELPGSDMGMARNHGMRLSRGRYLAFLDSDDFYLDTKLEKQVAELELNAAVDVTFCAAWHFRTARPGRIGTKLDSVQPIDLKDFLAGRNHNLNAMCIRRSVLEAGFVFGEGDRGRYGEEWRLQLSMARSGISMSFKPEPLVVAELRPDSHTIWSRQWIMKQQAIAEIQHTETLLTDAQKATVDMGAIVDQFRNKLLIALLLDGQVTQAQQIAATFDDEQLARKARRIVGLARCVPKRLLAGVLRGLWLWRQDRSFDWQATPSAIREQIGYS